MPTLEELGKGVGDWIHYPSSALEGELHVGNIVAIHNMWFS